MRKYVPIRGFQIVILILTSALVGYFFGTNQVNLSWKDYRPVVGIDSKTPPPTSNLDMTLFYEVLDRVNQDYYDKSKFDSKKLLHGAINGMLSSLNDPYTSFFPPKENEDFKERLAGEFQGIGAELSLSEEQRVMVVAPLDGMPAQKAGIRAGDLILRVDDKETLGWTIAEAVENIRGPGGSTVKLTVLHRGEDSPVEISIVRDVIVIKSVTGWVKKFTCNGDCQEAQNGSAVGYIRLSQFGDKTNDEWMAVVNDLNNQISQESNYRGMILDLRNNPGGYLTDAVFVASEFLNGGVVVIQEDASKKEQVLRVSRRGTLIDDPLIVLINQGSASASEIVAGALRDHNRATLVGAASFGKGTVQQAVDVDDGASVHISVARWLTPNKAWVNENKIEPEIAVEYDASKSAQLAEITEGFDNQLDAAIRELLK